MMTKRLQKQRPKLHQYKSKRGRPRKDATGENGSAVSKKDAAASTDRLLPRQRLFIGEYAISGNATEAAIKAGYGEKAARATGAKLAAKPAIKALVEQRQAARLRRIELSGDMVIQEMWARATGPSDPALPTPGTQATLLAKLAELLVPKPSQQVEVSGGLLSVQVSAADLESARQLVETTLKRDRPQIEGAVEPEDEKS